MLASTAIFLPKKFSNFCVLTPLGAFSPMSLDRPCTLCDGEKRTHWGGRLCIKLKSHLDPHLAVMVGASGNVEVAVKRSRLAPRAALPGTDDGHTHSYQ